MVNPAPISARRTLFLFCAMFATAQTWGAPREYVELPQQSLASALQSVGAAMGVAVVFDPAVVGQRTAPAIRGDYAAYDAFGALLQDSGLELQQSSAGAYVVAAASAASATATTPTRDPVSPAVTQSMPVSEGKSATTAIEEIIVTAQKREESLQDAPLAISAITANTIIARGITDVGSLTAIAPNLVVSETSLSSTTPAIAIRGISSADPILTVDAPNAIYVDGVVIGRATGAMFDLVDLERIEVLRGPQGTLYGRNTTGGAINLITAKPADIPGFQQMLGYGRFELAKSRTTLDTGELGSSGVRAKFSYLHRQRDGYINNVLTQSQDDPGSYDVDAFRVAISYNTGGPVTALYTSDLNKRHSRSIPAQLAAAAPFIKNYLGVSPLLGGAEAKISRSRLGTLALDHDGPLKDRVSGHALTVEVDINDDIMIRSITSYRKWASVIGDGDLDGNAGLLGFTVSPAILAPPYSFIPEGINPINLYSGTNNRKQDQWSQEVSLIGSFGEKLEYILGAFYFREKVRESDHSKLSLIIPTDPPIPLGLGISTPAFGVNIDTFLDYGHKSESKALFGQATYELTDKLSATGGLRYTWDKRNLNQVKSVVVDAGVENDELTWMANVKYDLTSDVSGYARVATGYKTGGFNPRGSSTSFDPEKVTSYELGLKSELFDRQIRLNLAGFYTIYRDMQVSQFEAGTDGATSVTVNAGKAKYTGIEAELLAQITPGLTLSSNAGYVHRKYTRYMFLDPVTDTLVNMANVARFSYSASTTANIGLEYRFPDFGLGVLSARTDYTYRGKVYYHPLDMLSPFNREISDDSVSTLDARVALSEIELGDAQMTLALWGKNITDKHYLLSGIDFGQLGFATVSYAEPRTWGVDFTLNF